MIAVSRRNLGKREQPIGSENAHKRLSFRRGTAQRICR